jgi:hypothetical protein
MKVAGFAENPLDPMPRPRPKASFPPERAALTEGG